MLEPIEPIVVVRLVPKPIFLCLLPNRDRYPNLVVVEPPSLLALEINSRGYIYFFTHMRNLHINI